MAVGSLWSPMGGRRLEEEREIGDHAVAAAGEREEESLFCSRQPRHRSSIFDGLSEWVVAAALVYSHTTTRFHLCFVNCCSIFVDIFIDN